MGKGIIIILLHCVLGSLFAPELHGQFTNPIAKIYGNWYYLPDMCVAPLGDQNHDGYADFFVYDCATQNIQIYFGSPSKLSLPRNYIKTNRQFAAIDCNGDGDKDLLLNTADSIKIYYGGLLLDTIADLTFPHPPGSSYLFGSILKNIGDFNGDGFDDLLIRDSHPPYTAQQWGYLYIYSGKPPFSSQPVMTIIPDTLQGERMELDLSFGDLNGDGRTDLWIKKYKQISALVTHFYADIIAGNSEWDSTPVQSLRDPGHAFKIEYIRIIPDMNGDGCADLLFNRYGTWYPAAYNHQLVYGSIPIDTIPDAGLYTQTLSAIVGAIAAGDVNHDGYMDMLTVQIEGMSYPIAKLWFGSKDMRKDSKPKQTWGNSSDFYGGLVARLGDVNGDGIDDFAVGSADVGGGCVFRYLYIYKGDSTQRALGTEEWNGEETTSEYLQVESCYPNPGNGMVNYEYRLKEPGNVLVELFTTGGELVRELERGEKISGSHRGIIQGGSLSSGVYVLRIAYSSGGVTRGIGTRKINWLK